MSLSAPASLPPLIIHRFGNPDAPPVVLVHGLTEAGTAWPDLVSHWGDRWDVHAPDLRGHGLSPRLSEVELDDACAVLLRDVVALVDAAAEPVALVGHSLGGRAALLAGGEPGVHAVVALNPWVYPTDRADLSGRDVLVVHGTDDRIASPERARVVASTIPDATFLPVGGGKHAMLRHGGRFERAAADFVLASLLGCRPGGD